MVREPLGPSSVTMFGVSNMRMTGPLDRPVRPDRARIRLPWGSGSERLGGRVAGNLFGASALVEALRGDRTGVAKSAQETATQTPNGLAARPPLTAAKRPDRRQAHFEHSRRSDAVLSQFARHGSTSGNSA